MPFQYSQYQSPYEGSIGELMARKGDIAAHALRQQGQGRANLIASVGQAAGQTVGTIGDLMQQRQAHRQAVQQKMLTQEQARAAGRFLQESVARNKQPDGSVNHDAVVSELNASPFAELGIAEEYLKQAKGLADLKPKPVEAKPTPTRAVTTRAADGTETTQIVADTPGQTFSSAPAPKPAEKPPANIDDAILAAYRAGDGAEVNRLMGLKRQLTTAGREPEKPEKPKDPPAPPKLPAAMAQAVAASQTSIAALDRLEKLFTDDMVGPWAGRYNQYERSTNAVMNTLLPDAPKGFDDFSAETATLKNQVIQAITGAAVGVQEQGRIMEQIPDVTDPPAKWRAKAKATRRNLQTLMANQVRMGSGAQAPLQDGMTVDLPPQGAADPLGLFK